MWTSPWETWTHSGSSSYSWSRYHANSTETLTWTREHLYRKCCVCESMLKLPLFLSIRALSCVELLPCRWKTWCLCGRRGSRCHPVKSRCYNTMQVFCTRPVDETSTISLALLPFQGLLFVAHPQSHVKEHIMKSVQLSLDYCCGLLK